MLILQYGIRRNNYLDGKKRQAKRYYEKHKTKEQARKRRWAFQNWQKIRDYNRRLDVTAKQISRLYRYMEEHPHCNIERIEGYIRAAERNVSLTRVV